MEKDDFFIKRIRELANLSYQRDIVTFSDFLNLNEQNLVKSQAAHLPGVIMESFGGYDQAERQMIAFHPDALVFSWEYPVCCLKIQPRAVKFSETLSHRDYLGTILGLGVERSVIGDILVQEHVAWVFCHKKIADFLIENLCRVRHTTVFAALVEDPQELPAPEFELVSGTCSSIRLDALIAVAFQASRSSMVSFIEGGQVFVNGKLITSNGYEPREGDIVSVRGKGRFLFEGTSGKTRKGRISVRLQKYV
nr:YlmH/Sll1252 family protein [uncultured Blautia sp.]